MGGTWGGAEAACSPLYRKTHLRHGLNECQNAPLALSRPRIAPFSPKSRHIPDVEQCYTRLTHCLTQCGGGAILLCMTKEAPAGTVTRTDVLSEDLLLAALNELHDAAARLIVLGYTPHEVALGLGHFTDSLPYPEVSSEPEGENE